MGLFSAAFSDIEHIEEDIVAEGDRVGFRTRLRMAHTGEFMGIAGSDRQIPVVEMRIMRIENGKTAERWGLLDTLGLLQQIGSMLSPS
jgi:predicted ester cyclase